MISIPYERRAQLTMLFFFRRGGSNPAQSKVTKN